MSAGWTSEPFKGRRYLYPHAAPTCPRVAPALLTMPEVETPIRFISMGLNEDLSDAELIGNHRREHGRAA